MENKNNDMKRFDKMHEEMKLTRLIDIPIRLDKSKKKTYKQKRKEKHKVKYLFSGRNHFFEVITPEKKRHEVRLNLSCTCEYMGIKGVATGKICSHILAVMQEIQKTGNIEATYENLIDKKKADCISLVKPSNRELNTVRFSSNETKKHKEKKEEVCKKLKEQGIDFITEAIFTTGGRADVLVLQDFTAVEIMSTEKDESIEEKMKLYPQGIKIKTIKCN